MGGGTRIEEEPRWLNETERQAWMGLITLHLIGMPELDRTFRRYGLVHVEYALLAALGDHPAGLRLTQLAATVHMSPSRLTHRMRKLIDRGYVEVTGCAADGRVSIARITEQGRAFAAQAAPEHVRDVRRILFDHLSPDQVRALAGALSPAVEALAATPLGQHLPPWRPTVPESDTAQGGQDQGHGA